MATTEDLSCTVSVEDEESFRARARAWLRDNIPPLPSVTDNAGQFLNLDARLPGEDEASLVARSRRLQGQFFDGGFAGLDIPTEFGGRGLTNRHQAIFEEEALPFQRPGEFGGTFNPILPVLLAHCTDERLRRHVPEILAGRELWAQMMSEPGAGSDLAGITTSALRDGDEWILNGQKVWTTGAHVSDFGMCLARTNWDVPKHAGLTMFIVDLKAPGVAVRPLRQITGESKFNEVFLTDVHLDGDAVIGEVGHGWRVVKTWLVYEHKGAAKDEESHADSTASVSPIAAAIPHDLIGPAREAGASADPGIQRLIVQTFIDDAVFGLLSRRLMTAMRTGAVSGQAGSLLKILGSEIDQRRAGSLLTILGPAGVAWSSDEGDDEPARRLVMSRMLSIAGGTNEIHRNTLGDYVLGLPREPAYDRDIPFRDVLKNSTRGPDTRIP